MVATPSKCSYLKCLCLINKQEINGVEVPRVPEVSLTFYWLIHTCAMFILVFICLNIINSLLAWENYFSLWHYWLTRRPTLRNKPKYKVVVKIRIKYFKNGMKMAVNKTETNLSNLVRYYISRHSKEATWFRYQNQNYKVCDHVTLTLV